MPDRLPEGYQLGWETRDDHSLSRDYDYTHNNETTYHSLRVSLSRYDSADEARARLDGLKAAPGSPSPDETRDEGTQLWSRQLLGDSTHPAERGTIERAYAQRGAYLTIIIEQSRGEGPLTDVSALANATLARATR